MSLKSGSAEVYVASIINDVIGDGHGLKDTNKTEIVDIFLKILTIAKHIQRALFHKPQEAKEVAHYTSLDTLKNLVSKEPGKEIGRECFRLYNSAYMNDPKEGGVFFEMMNERMNSEKGQEYDLENRFYGKGSGVSSRSPAYIGSFTPVDSKGKKENLLLWLAYGKQGNKEAAGSCLFFTEEGFAEKYRLQIGPMRTASTEIGLDEQDSNPPIYNIAYIDKEKKNKFGDVNKKVADKLREELDKLAECLRNVEGIIEKAPADTKGKFKLKQLVRELLDSIRFLFKTSHYEGEREFRVLELDYSEENTEKKLGKIKVDAEKIPPRFYLEAPESFRFTEVILGPQVQNFQEWHQWITERDPDKHINIIRKSDIPYGS